MDSKYVVWLALVQCAVAIGCAGAPAPLPPVPPPVAGYWYDDFRDQRAALERPGLIAGAARIKLTPARRGVRVAGHGHYRKHSVGVLDDLYARVLYLDTGADAVVLVSLDFIGWMHPRVERIRARVSRRHTDGILIASTHNHDGPDTEGLWGEPLFGLLPIASGIDGAYLDWVERRVARAILAAVARARPARLLTGEFAAPAGQVVNMREPDDVPLTVRVLRAETLAGRTIGTLIDFGNHAEALQDDNRWISADWPGVLCAEVDRALGGTTLFFSGPAGGMLEPANEPSDPEPARIAFMRRFGGALAGGAIRLAYRGMDPLDGVRVRHAIERIELPVDPGGTVALVMRLGLLEPRPLRDGRLTTEVAIVDLGPLQLVTIPGEITPEVGRAVAAKLPGPHRLIVTLGLDHLGYMISARQWADPDFAYERSMSLGPDTTGLVLEAVGRLVDKVRSEAAARATPAGRP